MAYEMLVLDLDGTLTNSEKKITEPTKKALLELQQKGKHVVLASGRPTCGILPLAEELEMKKYGNYILSYNGACIINCGNDEIIYNKTLPQSCIKEIYDCIDASIFNLVTYQDDYLICASEPNKHTYKEASINKIEIKVVDNFVEYVDYPVNKVLVTGDPELIDELKQTLRKKFKHMLNIFCSYPFFLEIMPSQIDKAHSLHKLLSSLRLSTDQMICCGDGENDITMLECAGLGVAMANAQSIVLEKADYVTKSNDEDGVLHVIREFF